MTARSASRVVLANRFSVAPRKADRRHGVFVDEVLEAVALDDQGVAVEAPQHAGDPLAGGEIASTGRIVTSAGPRTPEDEANTPLVREADPELERLLAEEEEIERRIHDSAETPHFKKD